MNDWQQRAIDEKAELDKKIVALEAFLVAADDSDTWPPKGLTVYEAQRINEQRRVMSKYSAILGQRILHFK